MKRDMDLVRQILLELEQHPFDGGWLDLNIEGRSDEEVAYHVMLLDEAYLISAADLTTHGGIDWKPIRLTWQGHEFLDAARSDTVWNKAQKMVKDKVGSVSFTVLTKLLIELGSDALGLS